MAQNEEQNLVIRSPAIRTESTLSCQRLTAQNIALTLREKSFEVSFDVFPLGVVVRFRAVVAENITQRPYGQQFLKLFYE